MVAASPDYLARYGTPNRPEDISAHQSLALGQAWSWEFANGAQTVAIRLTPRLRSDNTAALRTAALAGLGLLRTTEITISDDLVSGRLIAVLADHIENSSTGIFALYQNSHRGVLRQRLFLDHMAQWFKARRS